MSVKSPRLKAINTSEEVFDNIIKTMSSRIIHVSRKTFNNYVRGYSEDNGGYSKKYILYDDIEYIIIQEYLYAEFAGIPPHKSVTSWKQIKVRRTKGLDPWEDSIDGPRATLYMNKLLAKYYTEAELDAIYKAHESPYDPFKKQYHYTPALIDNKIHVYDNCVKYDINGAHQDALIDLFPRAKNEILKLYNMRKTKPVYKKYMNFFVGDMCKHGHRLTYNWVVQRTTDILLDGIAKVGGTLLYANTDGFMVTEPDNLLKASSSLGEFKEEYKGKVAIYNGPNYFSFELLDLPKDSDKRVQGTLRLATRSYLDLEGGTVVLYNQVGQEKEIQNIRTAKVDIIYEEKDSY